MQVNNRHGMAPNAPGMATQPLGGAILRYLQGFLIITLLVLNKRYREKWRAATNLLSETCDTLEAGQRRKAATENGGKPKLKVL